MQRLAALALALTPLLAACPGGLEDPERFVLTTCGGEGQPVCTTSTSTIPPLITVFRPRCGIQGCHAQPNAQSDLDLFTGGVAERLISVTSTTDVCMGRTMVVPGDPAQSLIYTKMAGTPPCGIPMPPGTPLPQEEVEAVRLWIEALEP